MTSLVLRRNLFEDVAFSGVLLKPWDFFAYSLEDVHLNPEIYLRPYEFDPLKIYSRLRGRQKAIAQVFLSRVGWWSLSLKIASL